MIAVGAWKSVDKSQLVGALLLVALGAFVAADAWRWPYLTKDGPGPGFFPLWIGIALIVLSGAQIVVQVATSRDGKDAGRTSWKGAAPVLAGWVALMVAAALIRPAGFVASYALLTIFLIRFVFQRSWTAAVTVSLTSAAGFWVLFVKLLRVQLPAGPWGF
ncbi:MAG: tripartite tricarboxylate transporter TctB family protein [Betaproteobacteria bacterium]|nr:tripartite tricarboxylate transporter TctB family protein [Betaproteobacteria bacterium]